MDEVTRGLLNRSMAALADGDRSAFDAVYRILWPVLTRFVAAMSARPMMAEDIVQQSMLKILTRASTFDPSMDSVAWSMAIAVNEYRSYLRKLSNRAADDCERAWLDPIDANSPEAIAIRTDLGNAARAVLNELRPQDLEVVVAAIYEAPRPRLTAA